MTQFGLVQLDWFHHFLGENFRCPCLRAIIFPKHAIISQSGRSPTSRWTAWTGVLTSWVFLRPLLSTRGWGSSLSRNWIFCEAKKFNPIWGITLQSMKDANYCSKGTSSGFISWDVKLVQLKRKLYNFSWTHKSNLEKKWSQSCVKDVSMLSQRSPRSSQICLKAASMFQVREPVKNVLADFFC